MSVSRRFFVVGSGGLITSAFLKEAKAAIAETGSPLLLRPTAPSQELFVEWTDYGGRLHLGTPEFSAPPPPLWIDHLKDCGAELETPRQILDYCDQHDFLEEDLWKPVDGYWWEDHWEYAASSEAKAYQLLDSAEIFPTLLGLTSEGSLVFQAYPNPMSSARWVEVHDPLSLSLLQSRFNELELGIAIRELPPDPGR